MPLFSLLCVFLCLVPLVLGNTTLPLQLSSHHQRLASTYCFINNYTTWLEQQSMLAYFLQFSRFFDLDKHRIEQELEQYRLQHECLRALERLPILVGGG
jgi:hypothetical protein